MKISHLTLSLICFLSLPLKAQINNESIIFDQQKVLDAHNTLREEVGVAPLIWSTELATKAKNWADKLALKNQGKEWFLEHSGSGENLAGGFVRGDAPEIRVLTGWGGEKENFDFASKKCLELLKCGHYSQIVWRNSTKVGCGVAVIENGKYILVCNYDPPGNFNGQAAF